MSYVVRETKSIDPVHRLDAAIFEADEPSKLLESAWFLVKFQGQAVAFGGIRDDGFLLRAGVLPQHRGNGLQRRLIRRRVKWAKDNGLRKVWTYTSTSNASSANNLIREGFEVYVPEEFNPGEFIYWRKRL